MAPPVAQQNLASPRNQNPSFPLQSLNIRLPLGDPDPVVAIRWDFDVKEHLNDLNELGLPWGTWTRSLTIVIEDVWWLFRVHIADEVLDTAEFGNVGSLTVIEGNSTVPTVSFLDGAEPFERVYVARKETPEKIAEARRNGTVLGLVSESSSQTI